MILNKMNFWVNKEHSDYHVDVNIEFKCNNSKEAAKLMENLVQIQESPVVGFTSLANRLNRS